MRTARSALAVAVLAAAVVTAPVAADDAAPVAAGGSTRVAAGGQTRVAAAPDTPSSDEHDAVWRRGGMNAPYQLFPVAGGGVVAAGYTGGAASVGRDRIRWRFGEGAQLADAAVGDLTGDGRDDVVLGEYPGTVRVLDGASGIPVASLAVPAPPDGVVVADATGDGRGDLYVVTSGRSGSDGTANTVALVDGASLAVRWTRDVGSDQGPVVSATTGDLDGDGREDVVFGTYDNGPRVYAYAADGTALWDADIGGTVLGVAVGDGGRTVFATRRGGGLASLDGRTGAVRWTAAALSVFSRLVAADVDGDGTDDAVWTSYGATGVSPTYQVLVSDGVTGLPQWAASTAAPPKGLAVGDLTADGRPDVAVSTQDPFGVQGEQANFVWAYDGPTGRALWSHALTGQQTTYLSDLALVDVAGGPAPEVVVAPYFDVLLGLDAASGTRVWDAPLGSSVTAALVADVDGDRREDVVEGGGDFTVVARNAATGAARWSRPLGGEIVALAPLPTAGRADVLAIALNRVHRVRGTDGAVLWSQPLEGWGTAVVAVDTARDGEHDVIVGSRLPRATHGLRVATDYSGGSLSLLDAADGRPRWSTQTVGAPLELAVADVSGDGVDDLVTATVIPQGGVTAYDGARLGLAPVPLWRSALDAGVVGIDARGATLLAVLPAARAVVGLDPRSGTERWRTAVDDQASRSIGFDDVNGDGQPDALVATRTFAAHLAAVDGASGAVLFRVDPGVRFLAAARWAAQAGRAEGDLLLASNGGGYGHGGLFLLDGPAARDGVATVRWRYTRINAYGMLPVADAAGWLAYGNSVQPDALALLRPRSGA